MAKVLGSNGHHLMPPGDPLKPAAIWIDDAGRELPHEFITFDLAARRRAFRHMGMVELVMLAHTMIIRWDVKHAATPAIVTAAAILAEQDKSTNVNLEFFWGGWVRERDCRPAQALRRIIDIAPYADVEPFLGTMVLARDSTRVREEGELIRNAFEYWDSNAFRRPGRHGPDGMGRFSNYSLAFSFDRSETEMLVRHVGRSSTAVSVFGDDWATTSIGRPCVRSQPDFEYEDRVCRDYERVMATGDLKLDHVRAFIRRPDNDPVWFTYKRILMRTRNSMGVPTLVAFSEWDDNIDIPLIAA